MRINISVDRGSAMQDDTREGPPPYAPYSSWQQLLDGLKRNIPARIDNSYLKQYRFNQSTRSMIATALDFFRLVDKQGVPTEKLQTLAQALANGDKSQLRELVENSYRPLLEDIDLSTATPDMLQERFKAERAKGDVVRKCVSFFVALADDTGMQLSPHIHRRRRQPRGPSANSNDTKTVSKSDSKPVTRRGRPPSVPARDVVERSLAASLVDKFPSANPDWNQETMGKWMDNWSQLLKIVLREKIPSNDDDGI